MMTSAKLGDEYHIPVLLEEVITGFSLHPGSIIVDATAGGGGHTIALAQQGATVYALDTDTEAREEVQKKVQAYGVSDKVKILSGNFRDVLSLVRETGIEHVDGVLFDLGVSSRQLDKADRGFSYRYADAVLDMRLDQSQGIRACDFVQKASEEELYETIATLGEEERARSICRALILSRSVKPIQTVGEFVTAIDSVLGEGKVRQARLSRVFQALRMQVNDELGSLRSGLSGAYELLDRKGILAVISFHSLEDRFVKQFIIKHNMNRMNKKPIIATEKEQRENSRSRSAKLRLAEKI